MNACTEKEAQAGMPVSGKKRGGDRITLRERGAVTLQKETSN
jgi:hypothetical protein